MKSSLANKIVISSLGVVLMAGNAPSQTVNPEWWTAGPDPVLTEDDPKDKAPANLGQAKWFAKRALETLEEVLPTVAPLVEAKLVGAAPKPFLTLDPPANPDAAWFAAQKKPLQLGQLKAIAKPFYDELNAVAPEWLEDNMTYYGTRQPVAYATHYPWSADEGPTKHYAPANLGQLKAVFALRFTESLENDPDKDDTPDLLEEAAGMWGL